MDSSSLLGPRNTIDHIDRLQSASTIRDLRALHQNSDASEEKQKIEKSAREFESILVAQWLEAAEKSFATVPGEDPDKKNQDVGQDQFRSIAFHSLADGLTKGRGFGIASMIARHLEAVETSHPGSDTQVHDSAKP